MKNLVVVLLLAFLLIGFAVSPVLAQETPSPPVQPPLDVYIAVAWIFVGVFLSFFIPFLSKYRVQTLGKKFDEIDHKNAILGAAAPYFITAVQSFLISIVVIAAVYYQGIVLTTWYQALIIGYTFDATIQKVKATI